MKDFLKNRLSILLGLVVIVVGVVTAVSHRATAGPAADSDLYLPFIAKPGTPPPQIAGCDILPQRQHLEHPHRHPAHSSQLY